MRRRDFVIVLAGSVTVWPFTVDAQQPAMPVIGFLSARSPQDSGHLVEAFRKGLSEAGFIEGRNVLVEYRWALGQHDQLPRLAADLVRKPVAILVTTGGDSAALAAKGETSTIPIAFITGSDPVKLGLVVGYQRPGGNATGITILTTAVLSKRFELLRQLLPHASRFAALFDPNYLPYEAQLRDLREAAHALDVQIQEFQVGNDTAIDQAFEAISRERIAAVIIVSGPFFDTRRDKLVALAARHAVPTMYQFREFTEAGGLISYGIDSRVMYRQIGVYAGGILKGEKPAELPVLQPTKFELVINMKTAKALGLKIPLTLQVAADEVIE